MTIHDRAYAYIKELHDLHTKVYVEEKEVTLKDRALCGEARVFAEDNAFLLSGTDYVDQIWDLAENIEIMFEAF